MKALNLVMPLVGILILSACGATGLSSSTSKSTRKPVGFVPFRSGLQPANAGSGADALMARLKYKSCMFNDLLSEAVPVFNGTFDASVALLKRSNCESLPRAVETWSAPPDWSSIARKIEAVRARTGRDYDYGMFIAESVLTTAIYYDDQGSRFDFSAMCKPGSQGQWGANTCVPHFDSPEFVRYVRYIVGKAADVGITNVLIGQTGHTDPNSRLQSITGELRALASARGRTMLIGQQPNGNQPASYLRAFDFVVGPSYVGHDVSQSCLPGIPGCQAVLFHASVVANANNVISEYDWSSLDDDIHRYAKLSVADRERLVGEQSQRFFAAGVGFTFPFRIVLNGGSPQGNCFGPNQYTYMASNEYGCKDETFLNRILAGGTVTAAPTNTNTNANPSPTVAPSITHTQARAIVVEAYRSILGRTQPEIDRDAAGVNYWTGRIAAGYSVESFYRDLRSSDEHYVRGLYKSILRRTSSADEIQYWLQQIGSGAKTRDRVRMDLIYACMNHVGGECTFR